MFEQASRLKLRFDSPKGMLTVEDLWDLPLTSARGANLNDVAKSINRELKAAGEEEFVNPPTAPDESIQLGLNIVKHIISVKQAENEAARAAAARREQKARLLEIIAHKQDEDLQGRSVDELKAMVEAL